MLGQRNTGSHEGWPRVVGKNITSILFGPPDYDNESVENVGFIPEYLFAPSLAANGPPYQPPVPTSPGLLHQNDSLGFDSEDQDGLAHRADWSSYDPSCGWSQNDLTWSTWNYVQGGYNP